MEVDRVAEAVLVPKAPRDPLDPLDLRVTSTVSMLRNCSAAGSPGVGIGLAIAQLPVGWVFCAYYGARKDIEFVRYGQYAEPGTMKLRWVFDPWWGFPEGPLSPEYSVEPGHLIPP